MRAALVLSFLSFSLFAQDSTQVIKTFDGQIATCTSAQDQRDHRLGVYKLNSAKVRLSEKLATVTLEVSSFKCVRTFTGYRFASESMYAQKEIPALDSSVTQVEVIDARLKAYVDGVYELIADKSLRDEATQKVSFKVELADIPIVRGKRQFDVFLSKMMRFSNESNGASFVEHSSYGSYRIKF